MNQTKKMKRAK